VFLRKKKQKFEDPVEVKFDAMMNLIKDLSKADYNRLKKAMDYGWQSYQTVRNVKTDDEKEYSDINEAEAALTKEASK
jgi:hypothetical protein